VTSSVENPTDIAEIVAWEGVEHARRIDALAVEEPLEMRLAGLNVAVTMRTPGDDIELTAGFLLTEGIIGRLDDIATILPCPSDNPGEHSHIINLNPTNPALVTPERWHRAFVTGTSCGICGKDRIDAVRRATAPIRSAAWVSACTLYEMEASLRDAQWTFGRTGGLHAAGLFDLEGRLLLAREDVGRHNAVDKLIGHALLAGDLPLHDRVLLVSGRASFELVQKALVAGIPIMAAVSAPSSLAVTLAREAGMTLVGFLRSAANGRFNVYAGAERIIA
jgi:FdhD protein